jgi:3-methyladenine DNA glycosylase/8-oxoguanine DNA glycosylase
MSPGSPERRQAGEPPAVEPLEATYSVTGPVDLRSTIAGLRHGRFDPTMRLDGEVAWLAHRTKAGPATLRLSVSVSDGVTTIHAGAWGRGAAAALEDVPGLAGLLDDPSPLTAHHPLIREIQRRLPGLRLPRTGRLFESLVAAVIEQKVTAEEAHDAYAALVRRTGEAAPGPADLLLPPEASRVASLPYFDFHPMGLERRRAELIVRIARSAASIEGLMALEPEEARMRLQKISGIGPWTAAEATARAFGDPDAVTLGDAHLPDLVSWALAREARANDRRMLELLEPYKGQRRRVVELLKAAGIKPPRFGPRFTPGRIGRL